MVNKKIILVLGIFLFIIPQCLAIRINEVELNPEGTDSGMEWVELYSSIEINLEDYKLVNNDGDEINLSGSFLGYYIHIFDKQWLDNSDEKVLLYKDNDLIDETEIFKDDKNNLLTWQLCENWEFKESTKEEENNCVSNTGVGENTSHSSSPDENEPEENEDEEEEDNSESEIICINQEKNNQEKNNKVLDTINLNTEKNTERLTKRDYALYGLIIFTVFIIILFLLKRKKDQNEFR